MEIRFSHSVQYETPNATPVADVVAALLAAERLLIEITPLVESAAPAIRIERVAVSVREISQQSPLHQMLAVSLFVAFQKDLEVAVPALVEKLTGGHLPQEYNSIVTLLFCVVLFYCLDFIYAQVNKGAFSRRIRGHLKRVARQAAKEMNISESRLMGLLEDAYGESRLRVIAGSAIKLFGPSKKQGNARVLIGSRVIDSATVADVPSDAQMAAAEEREVVRQYEDVEIELHAQDLDRPRQGWAAIVPEITRKRLRMEIYPPLRPEDIYTKTRIRGDVALLLRRNAEGKLEPHMIHLIRIR